MCIYGPAQRHTGRGIVVGDQSVVSLSEEKVQRRELESALCKDSWKAEDRFEEKEGIAVGHWP